MKTSTSNKVRYLLTALCLTAVGILFNLLGSRLGERFALPFIPSNLGTILVSAFGGIIPGVLSGFLSAAVRSIADTDAIFFCVVNVTVALIASMARSRRMFSKAGKAIFAVFVIFLAEFIPDMLVSWMLFGFEGGKYAALSRRFLAAGLPGEYAAHLAAFALASFCAVLVSLGVTLVIVTLTPAKAREWLWNTLNPQIDEKKLKVKRSLLRKVVAIVLIVEVLLGALAYALGLLLYHDAAMRYYTSICTSVTKVMSLYIDPELVDDYIGFGYESPDYKEIEKALIGVKNSFPLAEYVYVYRIEEDGCRVVFDPDPDGLEPGEVQEFDESFNELLPTLKAGGEIDPIVTDDTYGYLLTVYTPLKNTNGECACYVCADINMEDIITDENIFLVKLMSTFLSVSIVIMCVVLELVKHTVAMPLNKMALAAGDFAFDEDEKRSESLTRLEALDIRSKDELGNLYASLRKMAQDSARYIDEIKTQSGLLSKMQEEIIVDFADMVEARDKCTGDHIKNTSAYVEAIATELKDEGAFPEQMTDEYVARLVRSAPLHDVGKIKISDLILNKPGRLTDDEFALMKTHTSEGREILTHSSSLAIASGYLDQAIEMANYHHERWDGSGYPTGAAGEQIPLSARIMAVADVFDALVSKRSYKEPYSFDEAMKIINEESGTHFDPTVVEAFGKVAREVYDRMMAEEHKDGGEEAEN